MGMSTGKRGGVMAEINVVPLIDVTLVLLIIFMVITPMLQSGVPVELAIGADPAKKPDDESDVIVSIKYLTPEKHVIYYEQDPVAEEMLERMLTELHDRAPSTTLYIKADRKLRYGDVKNVMLLVHEAEFDSVSLIAEAPAN